ncbi:MAG TPA: hypothetical protein VF690_06845 [Hymenobacter sp.]|jgi:uncharacterized protein (DUF58 family)
MKEALILAFLLNLVALSLVALTAFMIYLDRPYWGWVLVSALLVTSIPSAKAKKSSHEA